MNPNTYYNILYVQILSSDQNNFASLFEAKKVFSRLYFGKTSYKDLVFAQNDFLMLVRAPNEYLILIIIYYMFKYSVGIKTTLLESLQSQKSVLKAIFRLN